MADTELNAADGSERDYPFYNGWPIEISALKWLVPLAAVGLAVAVLLRHLPMFSQGYLQLAPGMLLTLLPLLGMALVAGRHWTALFRRVRLKDIGWMFAFALLNYVIAVPLGFIVLNFVDTETNAAIEGLKTFGQADRVLFFVNSIPQLIGEELISIVPFLALLYYLTRKFGLSRRTAVIIAWLATAVWFAAIHLPTYNWNILQCLILIGGARLVLTLAYLKTKNLWVSAGAHIINDWMTFTLTLVGASMGAG
ncbi:CPBP family intramembrane glutamic endopeptidase [Novosphingobium pentaromativorans]|uniref:Amino terminal protease n=1 Tax=Novosphingobium pentaromativorans US6-1 TaxID=1088721 RepID=G6EI48_9SPHN|nr:CPBP family intramembrane glutamic endopeptidase [Novosphingobium pentaromativorans]AIT78678.1 peptidase [Novosphingobium pentaromativorans US6-1]EHJ59036.1 amino terminal protease [Novosphingobium pentaromativorans US6-1]